MTIEDGTAIVLTRVLVSMGVIIAFLLADVRDRMVHWSAAPAPPRYPVTPPNCSDLPRNICR
jgi:hypothetical protein